MNVTVERVAFKQYITLKVANDFCIKPSIFVNPAEDTSSFSQLLQDKAGVDEPVYKF
jgi:hypothetical protein